ncbi:MAG: AAA family ATPase [Henriciella sp.]|uniref:AAA family ATPase n=1 Tax=Henriciella sp. TaxID=1968823 RepID=UPI0032ECCF9D
MQLLFLYGPPAAGKYTIAKEVAERTGLPLFHNHLVVDAVASVFPFGSENFVRLREQFWIEIFRAAAEEGRSLIFTFQPEPSVAADFPKRVAALHSKAGGETLFIRLRLSLEEQLNRIDSVDRARFGKLRDRTLLLDLHEQFTACEAAMPEPRLTIDTGDVSAETAGARIAGLVATG